MFTTCRRLILLGVVAMLQSSGLAAVLPVAVPADHASLAFSGRRDDSAKGVVRIGYSGGRVRIAFRGDAIGMWMDSPKTDWVNVLVDGTRKKKLQVSGSGGYYELASDLGGGIHTVEVVKATEGSVGSVTFKGFALSKGAEIVAWPVSDLRKIEFVGDSITCGYGIEAGDAKQHFSPDTENFCDTYAWLAATALGADYLVVARSGIGMLRNYNGPADGSTDNMPAIYSRTLFHEPGKTWDPARFVPDVVCINLGTNDFSTQGVNRDKYVSNYAEFLKMLASRYPDARLVALAGPMLNSVELKESIRAAVDALNREFPGKASFFELSGQGDCGFGADYHPSQAQARKNGEELAGYLGRLMGWPLVSAAEK